MTYSKEIGLTTKLKSYIQYVIVFIKVLLMSKEEIRKIIKRETRNSINNSKYNNNNPKTNYFFMKCVI
jgi:hypothetical protein